MSRPPPPPPYRARDFHNLPSPNSYYTQNQARYTGQNYQSTRTEYTPLVPRGNRNNKPPLSCGAAVIVLFLLFLFLSGVLGAWIDRSINENVLDPEVRDRIRRGWELEKQGHRRDMEHAREREKQWKEKQDEWNEKQDEWNEKQDEWNEKQDEWNEKQDEWYRKEQTWQREWKEMERRAREEAERVEKEKWERERMNLYWEDLKGEEHCAAHRTKKYSARLANLLPGIDALEACKATPLTIHGVTYDTPLHCEDQRSFGGGVHGHWVNNDEPLCSTFWEYFKVKGCLAPGSGLQRVESPLGNLRSGDNYEDMCYSTPAYFYGKHYNGPNAGCVDWGKHGHWGIWDIPDSNCR